MAKKKKKPISPLEQIRLNGRILHAVRESLPAKVPYGLHPAYRKR